MATKPMEPCLYTKECEMIDVLDIYTSFIWTERYNKCGDFEFHSSVSERLVNELIPERYLVLDGANTAMIIETIKIDTSAVDGNKLSVSGRSVDSILDRRIVWGQTDLNSKIETAVERLLNENVINPSDSDRKIPGFLFVPSGDSRLDSIKVDKQFTGDNLLEAIQGLCKTSHVGYNLSFDPDSQDARFKFQLYFGEDRSYEQETNPWVIFSPAFDNLIGSNYTESKKLIKNVARILGEGEGSARKAYTIIKNSNQIGLDRRELYVDARDISQDTGESTEDGEPIKMSDAEYNEKLSSRGWEKLAECEDEKSFDGESEVVDGVFVYGRDFYMGDLVQVENEFGLTDRVRVTELIRSGDTNGFTVYPTFTSIDKEDEEVIT